MLQALHQNSARSKQAKEKFIPAPTKGWVSMNNISQGVPGTALILENFFPKADTVELRGGWVQRSDTTESTKPVNTLMAYHGRTSNKLFAVCNATIYDAGSTTAVASTITTLTSSKMQYVNFTTSGGHFLFCVNGADTAKYYDGSAWSASVTTGTTSDNFSHVNVYKQRLFFVLKNTMKFGYLPVQSITGAVSTFELGDIFNRGGTLVAMGTYTGDGGVGPDDHAVFISSQGQVALYQGSDPSDPNDWALVGVFDMARPLGTRCMVKVGGDIYINTEIGIIPLSQALKTDQATLGNVAISANIQQEINKSARLYKDNFGWQVIAYPKGTMAIMNIPVSPGVQQIQYVMNTQTGAWCKFTNQNANCWEVLDGKLYFGGNGGKIYEADATANDGGGVISGDMQTYYEGFGNNSRLKKWGMIRPNISSQGTLTPQIGLNIDYVSASPTGTIEAASSTNATWGAMTWGSFTWAGGLNRNAKWKALTETPGYVAAVRMKVAANGTGGPVQLQVNGFDISYELGGVI